MKTAENIIIVRRNNPSKDHVDIGPSKHAGNAIAGALPLVDRATILNPPPIIDFYNFLKIYYHLGANLDQQASGEIIMDSSTMKGDSTPEDEVRQTRATILLLSGALLRTGRISMPMPEGDWPGTRRTSSAIETAEEFGAEILIENDKIHARLIKQEKKKLDVDVKGKVFSTFLALILSTGLGGEYKIRNPLSGIEVDNLVEVLQTMGADITGLDSPIITVRSDGLNRLKSNINIRIAPDHCETVFWLAYSQLHQMPITIVFSDWDSPVSETNFGPLVNIQALLQLTNLQIKITSLNSAIVIPSDVVLSGSVDLGPPHHNKKGKPPDALPHVVILLGSHAIDTTYYDEKYGSRRVTWLKELEKIGARVQYPNIHTGIISGTGMSRYYGQNGNTYLVGRDIRSAASLLLAASSSETAITVEGVSHIRRAYTNLPEKMEKLGTEIIG